MKLVFPNIEYKEKAIAFVDEFYIKIFNPKTPLQTRFTVL